MQARLLLILTLEAAEKVEGILNFVGVAKTTKNSAVEEQTWMMNWAGVDFVPN